MLDRPQNRPAPQSMIGRSNALAHTLVPLSLAVERVKQASREADLLRRCGSTDANAIAAVIARLMPIYVYDSEDAKRLPSIIARQRLSQAVFRNSAKEVQFLDSGPPLHPLAVREDDVACVIEILRFPREAARIQSRFERARARVVRERARSLRVHSERLLRTAAAIEEGLSRAPLRQA